MPGDFCKDHTDFAKALGRIEESINNLKGDAGRLFTKIGDHIQEGEKPGGHRDRLTAVENTQKNNRNMTILLSIIGGLVGGIIGSVSPELARGIVAFIIKHL